MKKYEQLFFSVSTIMLYSVLIIINLFGRSEWILDNTVSIVFLLSLYACNKYLQLRSHELVMVNVSVLVHNLGMFAFYHWSWSIIEYDTVIHFITGVVGGYVLFSVVARFFHEGKKHLQKNVSIDKH